MSLVDAGSLKDFESKESDAKAFTLEHILVPLGVLVCFLNISAIVFVLECVTGWYRDGNA